MCNSPKILLVVPHLGGGGAERVVELLVRHLPDKKYDIHLALVTGTAIPGPPLRQSVTVHRIGVKRVRLASVVLAKLAWRLQPDLILSSMFHLNFLLLVLRPLLPRRVRILVRQNGTASAMLRDLRHPFLLRALYRSLYSTADRLLCQSSAMAEDLHRNFGIPARRIAVLPNPVDIETIRSVAAASRSEWTGPGPRLLSVARFRPEKGVDLLLSAFAEVKKHSPAAELTIVGDGPLQTQVEELAESLALKDCVRLAGPVSDPARFFKDASLFVLASRHEGMPNALLEAAAAGLPIVSTPASKGLVEILRGDAGCWVTAAIDASSLAQTLISAIDELRPGQRFPHGWIERFSLENAVAEYQSVIDSTLGFEPVRRPA